MPRRCKTCSHKDVKAIDTAIVSNEPYRTIASRYDLSRQTVQNHAKNHVKPLIAKANAKAEAIIVNKILKFREEVNYPSIEKVKFAQNRILNALDSASELSDQISIIKEFRGWIQEEAKLTGEYKKDGKNPANITEFEKAKQIYAKYKDEPGADKSLKQVFPSLSDMEIQEIVGSVN